MKRALCFTSVLSFLLVTPKTANAWIQFLDGSSHPTSNPVWLSFTDPGPDNTIVDLMTGESVGGT